MFYAKHIPYARAADPATCYEKKNASAVSINPGSEDFIRRRDETVTDLNVPTESREAIIYASKKIQNVAIGPGYDYFFTAKPGVKPTVSNLIETGFYFDDSAVLTLKRIKDLDGKAVTPRYYTSYLISFMNFDSPYAQGMNTPATLKQFAIHDGLDNEKQTDPKYPDGYKLNNRIQVDNIINSPVYEPGGTTLKVPGELMGWGVPYINNPGNIGVNKGDIIPGSQIGYNYVYHRATSGTYIGDQPVRKIGETKSLDAAYYFSPTEFLMKASIDQLQPQKFHQLPQYYKYLDNILDYANPAKSEYTQGGPILDQSDIPAGIYEVTIDVLDLTLGTEVDDTGVYFSYTERKAECDQTYFSTAGGDFRTLEAGAYKDKLGTSIVYSVSGNKYWRNTSADQSSFQAYDNEVAKLNLPKTSTFTFEADNSVARSSSNQTEFNNTASTGNISLEKNILETLSNHVSAADATNGYRQFTLDTLLNQGVSTDTVTKTISIDLKKAFDNTLTQIPIITIDDPSGTYKKVVITDSTSSTPDSAIIWCKTPGCLMSVEAIKTLPNPTMDDNQFTYNRNSVLNEIKSKSRVYLNYAAGESPTTPLLEPKSYSDNGTEKMIPATRMIELAASNANQANFYAGAFLTNGFIKSSKSQKTDVIHGIVAARGLVVNTNGVGTGSTYFQDYPLPFLYLDYDAKYAVAFMQLSFSGNQNTNVRYIGI